ncbi:hypothetical protein B296_00019507 [Ensete ventricosum]|uniref:Uncharacterized protein n=1 Tax=Ensete ventricosum TaxID=4639 RepID=A0A426YCK5_ENSVE|nr:hypothetical protein B296_00019507 [Ensete ventricosum]
MENGTLDVGHWQSSNGRTGRLDGGGQGGRHGNSTSSSPSTPPSLLRAAAMGRDDDKGAASEVLAVFRALVDGADRKFAHVRDLPPGARGPLHLLYFRKAFKAYTRLWQFQQRRRSELVAGGLGRWEIGEVASRIGQLFYGQYQRTSEVRFLLEVYVFYEAIMSRGYFQAAWGSVAPDLNLRYKELRFHVRFLIVALLLNRADEAVKLADRFRALVDESKAAFPVPKILALLLLFFVFHGNPIEFWWIHIKDCSDLGQTLAQN